MDRLISLAATVLLAQFFIVDANAAMPAGDVVTTARVRELT